MKRFLICVAMLAAACATDDDKPKPNAAPKAGEEQLSPVGVIPTALLRDAQRNKDLDISIQYPTKAGPSPVIIFSHGYGGSNRGYEPMVAWWTSHGYVVIRPSHADSGALREAMRDAILDRRDRARNPDEAVDDDDDPQPRRNRRRREAEAQQAPPPFRPNPAETIWEKEREPQWRDRARDITLILDSLGDLENRFPELKDKLDKTKIGVGGHSYGAFTAMLLGGMRARSLQLFDPRVTAILAMSPQGVAENRGLTAESWRELRLPAMFMTGTRDFGAAESETPEWRKAGFTNSPAGDKYWVLIEGARHLTFAGLAQPRQLEDNIVYEPRIDPVTGQQVVTRVTRAPGTIISDRGLFERIRSISMTFWDAYLKGDTKAKERLASGSLGGNTTVEKK
jgi:predicted dienelactone hydrolase